MTKENEKKVDVEPEEEIEDIEEVQNEEGEDITDWKALAEKNQGIAKRYRTKLDKIKEAEKTKTEEEEKKAKEKKPEEQPQDKKEFGYAEKSYLITKGIEEKYFPFVKEERDSSGLSIEELLASGYFQEKLKEKRDLDATEEALPEGPKRGGGGTRDTVDYWLDKKELPPADQPELRRQVLNEKIKRGKEGTKFTDRPVA